jgi:hypothetical protein
MPAPAGFRAADHRLRGHAVAIPASWRVSSRRDCARAGVSSLAPVRALSAPPAQGAAGASKDGAARIAGGSQARYRFAGRIGSAPNDEA